MSKKGYSKRELRIARAKFLDGANAMYWIARDVFVSDDPETGRRFRKALEARWRLVFGTARWPNGGE